MGFLVEYGILNPETEQYAGTGRTNISIASVAADARRIEELGFDGLCSPEAGHDAFLPLMTVAEHTKRVTMATNVAIAFPRSPLVTAQIAWDLQQYSCGRFRLGLGTQVKGHNELRYSTPWTAAPGPRLREYILAMKAMFESFKEPARPKKFEGAHYTFTLMPPFFNPGPIDYASPPIYLAAVNKYMCRLVGELCEGVRLHPIGTFSYTRAVAVREIERGAQKSGRSLADIDIVGVPFLAVGKDEAAVAKAKQSLKQHISFYASTRTYHAVLEHHGWEDVGQELHRLSREGKWTEMPGCITDEMLEEWAIVATYDQLIPKLIERSRGLFTTVQLGIPAGLMKESDRVREMIAQLHAA
jgi:probable F420-dependent oxidoreductase